MATATVSRCNEKLDASSLEALLRVVASSHRVTTLELRNAGLTPSLVVQLADFLEQNATLTHVDLSDNRSFGVHGARCLAASLAKNSTVTSLSLAKCGLKTEALEPWIEVFQRTSSAQTLADLNLSSNQLDEDSATCLAALLRTAQSTVSSGVRLDLRNNQLAAVAASAELLADALQANSAVVQLKLSGNQEGFDDDGDEADTLLKHHKRVEFYLRRNAHEQQRRVTLARVVDVRHSALHVQRCHFDHVDLSIADAQLLADALRVSRSVTELRLRSNALPAEGARRILLALCTNTSVRALAVVDNSIGDVGMRALAVLLRHQSTITTTGGRGGERHPLRAVAISNSLHLTVADGLLQLLSLRTASLLHHALASYATLRSLSLANCALSDRDVGIVVSGVAWRACVQELDVRGNCFGDASAHVFAHLLRRCRLFSLLDVSDNALTLDGALPIAHAAGEHPTLRTLVLGRVGVRSTAAVAGPLSLVCNALQRSFSLARVQLACRTPRVPDDLGRGGGRGGGGDLAARQVAALNVLLSERGSGPAALVQERNARALEDARHAHCCRFRSLVRREAERLVNQLLVHFKVASNK
ncbi:hypothetical protein PybrP1_009584 [[Pythium] brassicae (nom. inval.)]|nr:hypothetical protein PybrP1_009584 [[Pythium] brassicae (nom. inval.)]